MRIAALYINTTVCFKSNVTKIYYCWPPILSVCTICISDILRILVCDMARKILFKARALGSNF